MIKKIKFTLGFMSGVSVLAFATAGYAQESQGGVRNSQPLPESADALESAAIIVTGSRILRDGSESPVPLTIVSADELETSSPSSTIVQSLAELPSFAAAGPMNRPGNGSGNSSARVLALRGLGNNRTLVLFDGRRVPPMSATGQVNADFVPSMLLQRVDVVTGGVSAVYGSDAVAGVVNFVTDTEFTGLKVDGRFGISQLNDAENYKFGIAGGSNIMGGRGHIMGSYEYYNSPGVFDKHTRKFGRDVWSIQGGGTEANPYRVIKDTRLNQTSFIGNIVSTGNPLNANGTINQNYNNLGNVVFAQNSSAGADPSIVQPFRRGIPTGSPTVDSGGDGGYFYNASLLGAQRSHLLYGRFDYELTDSVNFFVLGNYNNTFNKNYHESVEFRLQTMSTQNAFLPIAIQEQLRSGPDARETVRASKIITQVPAKSPTTWIRGHLAVAGFEGALGDFNWEVAYQNAKNRQKTSLFNNTDNRKAAAALDAVDEGMETAGVRNGNVVCRVTITNPDLFPGCVPINIFGPTSESPEALNYILTTTTFIADTKLDNFNASITGPVFALPAGDVHIALSGEYRELAFSIDSDAHPIAADCTGLRYNCGPSTLQYQSNVRGSLSQVKQSVKEAAAEIAIPVLRDVPFASGLDFSGAARWTNYSNSGTVYTWKAGLEWAVNDDIRIRATRSRDIRAPNLIELYAPRTVNPAGNTDLHTNIVGQIPNISDSNPDLKPEVANAFTAGVVFRPLFLPRFTLSVDYYNIRIKGAISNVAGQNVVVQRLCEDSNGTSPLCNLIERPLPFEDRSPANFATAFYSRPLNASLVSTKGVDVEVSYSFDAGPGTVSFRSIASYQPELITVQELLGGVPSNSRGSQENPKLKITSFLGYRAGRFNVDLRNRWWSSEYYHANQVASNAPNGVPLVYVNLEGKDRMPAYHTTNLTIGYDATDNANLYFSVTNLFDKQPTEYNNIGGSAGVPGLFGGFRNGEDTVGRFFTFGFRYRM